MSEEQTDASVQDPAPAAPQPVATSTRAPGPWDQDIAFITDEATRNQVDQYLREKIQPRMTQLEQSAAAAAESQRLMNDLVNNPAETMEALAAELNWTPQQVQEAAEQYVEYTPPAEVDPRVQSMLEHFEQEQAMKSYDQEMERAVVSHPGLKPDLFHPFVSAADGDFDSAYQMYENWVNAWNTENAPATEETAAPPTLGGEAGNTTPPVQPKEQSLGDAIDSWLADSRTTDPPPVS